MSGEGNPPAGSSGGGGSICEESASLAESLHVLRVRRQIAGAFHAAHEVTSEFKRGYLPPCARPAVEELLQGGPHDFRFTLTTLARRMVELRAQVGRQLQRYRFHGMTHGVIRNRMKCNTKCPPWQAEEIMPEAAAGFRRRAKMPPACRVEIHAGGLHRSVRPLTPISRKGAKSPRTSSCFAPLRETPWSWRLGVLCG